MTIMNFLISLVFFVICVLLIALLFTFVKVLGVLLIVGLVAYAIYKLIFAKGD